MTTLTAPAAKSKASRTTCTLCMTIGDVSYGVEKVEPGEFGTRAWRLSKLSGGGEVYDLLQRHDGGHECDCPDFTVRHADQGTQCKHLRSAIRLGLLDAPAIVEAKAAHPIRNIVTVSPDKRTFIRPFGEGVRPTDAPSEAERAAAGRVLAEAAATIKATMKVEAQAARVARESRPANGDIVSPFPSPAAARRYDAYEWASEVLGPLAAVATPDQLRFATEVINRDTATSETVTPGGPSLEELRDKARGRDKARAAAFGIKVPRPDTAKAETPAPTPCCPAGESRPCQSCQSSPGFADAPTAAAGPLPTDEPIALDVWLQAQADVYDLIGTAAGRFLADHIRRLVADVAGVMTPNVPTIAVAEAQTRLEALAGA